jgi:hypothetical protein
MSDVPAEATPPSAHKAVLGEISNEAEADNTHDPLKSPTTEADLETAKNQRQSEDACAIFYDNCSPADSRRRSGFLLDDAGQNNHSLSCLDVLSGARKYQVLSPRKLLLQSLGATGPSQVHDPFGGTGLILPPMTPSLGKAQLPQFKEAATLSASAPEFVPVGVQASPEMSEVAYPGGTPPSQGRKVGRSRAPLGELTNIVNAEDLLKPFKSPTKKRGHGHLSASMLENHCGSPMKIFTDESGPTDPVQASDLNLNDESRYASDIGMSAILTASLAEEAENDKTDAEQTIADACKDDMVVLDGDDKNSRRLDETPEAPSSTMDLSALPSIGSALHYAGECKRCNFFAKGRCLNDKNCSFCHYPHDKNKLSRQEKREHRAARLGQETHGQAADAAPHEQVRDASATLWYLNPMVVGQSHGTYQAEDPSCSENTTTSTFTLSPTSQIRPALPPGLVPPQCMTQQVQRPGDAMLSTRPVDQPAVQHVVASSDHSSAPLSTAPSFSASPSIVTSVGVLDTPRNMSTSDTQTTEDFMCWRCEARSNAGDAHGSETSKNDHNGKQDTCWSREELLKLRGSIAKVPVAESRLKTVCRAAAIGGA